jgi:ferredoxin
VAPTKTSFNLSESILKDKNCNLVISKTIRMPNNYLIGFFKETTTLDCKLYSFNALKESKQIVDSFLNGNYSMEKVSSPLAFLSRKTNEFYGKRTKKAGVHFSVNDTCIECGICIKFCPTQNISFDGNKIIFKNSCIMCTRCANICPQNSIIYKDKKPAQYKYHIGKII